MARKDSDINTISDLKGRKVAAYISSAVYAQLYHALLEAGLNPVRDIKLVNLRPADWVPALRRKEIDAFMAWDRSEEHTSELQSLMRISYAVFCLKKKKTKTNQ